MRACILLTVAVIFICSIKWTDGSCDLPEQLRGTWIDTFKGSLEFDNSTITGYELHNFGTLTLTCYQKDDTVYILESSPFLYYGLNFTAYFCWNFTQVNDDMFYFYEYTIPISDAGYERVKIYLPALPRIYDDICSNPNVGIGTYRLLFRNGTIEDAISECPSQINGIYNYDVRDETGTSACNSSSNSMDACTNSSALLFNGTGCSIPLAYSYSGSAYCLFNVEDAPNKLHYMSLYNAGNTDESTTYSITCMILSYASSSLVATQYPKNCPDAMNISYVASPGSYVYFNSPSSCSASSAFPIWLIAVAIGIILLIAIIIFLIYRKKQKEKEKERRRLLDQEDGGERFDPDKFARGDRPPFVSITIMGEDGKRIKEGMLVDDGEKEPPKIKRPKSEGGKRRLDKRVRVWVVDKDGKVKKVWKEAGDNPDSGLEEDQVDGEGGSTGRKTLSSTGQSEKDDDAAFAKKYGRKAIKSAKELEEKGEKDKNSAKMKRKMKGMVSAKRSARLRRSAKSGRSKVSGRAKSAFYSKDDDGERSWGSDDGDYEEVDIDQLQREIDENRINEERETLEYAGAEVVSEEQKLSPLPILAVGVVNKDGEHEKLGDKDKKKGSKGKKSKRVNKDKKIKEEKSEEAETDKNEENTDQPSTSTATAAVATENQKNKKDNVKKAKGKNEAKKAVESKQKKTAPDAATSTKNAGEKIQLKDKSTEEEVIGTSEISENDAAVIGRPAIIATVDTTTQPEKTQAQIKAEQKKKEKEEVKRQKEDKKKQDKEVKEAKKNAEANEKEKAKALNRYGSMEQKEEGENDKKEDSTIVKENVDKEEDVKPSGRDSGHVTPIEESDKQEKRIPTPKKENAKPVDKKQENQLLAPSREQTLSSGMKPRREHSIVIDLDSSRTGSASVPAEKRAPSTAPGQGKKALEVVEELVDTARSQAKKADATLDESMIGVAAVPALEIPPANNESMKDNSSPDVSRGAEDHKDERSYHEDENVDSRPKSTKYGAKSPSGAQKSVKIKVSEADNDSRTSDIKNGDEDEFSSDNSSEPEVPVVRKKRAAQGFMLPEQNMSSGIFKAAADVIHTMPVKKKTDRRKPREHAVDVATLPTRTTKAFARTDRGNSKLVNVGRLNKQGQKDLVGGSISEKGRKPAPPAVKGPITIKDISKKPHDSVDNKSPQRGPPSESGDSTIKSGNTTQRSPGRKTSEVDKGHHLKLMTRLMSLAEGPENDDGSRPQTSKSRQSRLERAELSARKRAEDAAFADGTVSDSLNTPDALLTARQGPILPGRPPTHHNCIRPLTRESSAGTRVQSGVVRSHSDSRQAWSGKPGTGRSRGSQSASSVTSEDRFVRFREGVLKQLEELGEDDVKALMYPRVKRYPDDDNGPKRGTPAYRSMGTLQRIHRKSRKIAPTELELPPITGAYGRMIDDIDDDDDPRLKGLLEELYKDKKYMDKTLKNNQEEDEFLRMKATEGRSFLLNRARFWSTQQPLVRPGTQQASSRAPTAMTSQRLMMPLQREPRTRSEERPGENKKT